MDIEKKEEKKAPKRSVKKIVMYHGDRSVIEIRETEMKEHLKAGWRLNK